MSSIVLDHGRALQATPSAATPRVILHVDLDCFFVSVERVLNPSLSQRPVIVGGPAEARGVVTSASREARACGVHAGMPTSLARRLCPDATFLPGRGRMYARVAAAAQRVLREICPEVERASIDEAYLDLTGNEPAFGTPFEVAARIQAQLGDRLGLPSSIGIGSNKLIAKVACQRAKPEGIVEVWAGYEGPFLAPLEVSDIPGVGPVLAERLRLFGLRTVGDVARVDPAILQATYGAVGARLARACRGIDESAVSEEGQARSISRERTFTLDVVSSPRLLEEIHVLAADVARRLRAESLAARTVVLKLRTSDFKTITRSRTLPAPTDHASEIAGVACFLLREAHAGLPIRLLGIGVDGLCAGGVQEPLFALPAPVEHGALTEDVDPAVAAPSLEATPWPGLTLRWHPGASTSN